MGLVEVEFEVEGEIINDGKPKHLRPTYIPDIYSLGPF